jgi:hypothetical protein
MRRVARSRGRGRPLIADARVNAAAGEGQLLRKRPPRRRRQPMEGDIKGKARSFHDAGTLTRNEDAESDGASR